jgi:steroid delta-isomerase-like uncharacterized protein
MRKIDVELQQRRQAIVLEHLKAEDAHDFEACIKVFHRARYEIIPTGAVYDGHDGVMELLNQNITGFPDFSAEMVTIGHGEDAVYLETVFRGTHLGTWNGIPATGKKVDLPMMLVFLFEGDRMVCERTYFDLLTALRQLGVAPDPTAPPAKSFLEAYDALSASGGDPRQIAAAQFQLFEEWVALRPMQMFAQLREQRPIFQTPMATVITRFPDVREVVDLDEIFSVQPYGVGLMRNNEGPNFLLGMDDSPQFEKELATVRLALARDDMPRIGRIVQSIAQRLVEPARSKGRMEIADGYARLAPTLMVGEYFGVPGPDPKTLSLWVRRMLSDIFLNLAGDPAVTQAGAEAGRQFRDYVDRLIETRKARDCSPSESDQVLARLIALQSNETTHLEDSRVRDMLVGLVCGVLENSAAAVVHSIDWLFDHPEQMQGAVAAAQAGDDALLLKYVLETLRFHSPVSMMARLSTREHLLAKGTPRATAIPAGTLVYAANGSAMMDAQELERPEEFRLDRPPHHYLHFGWGLHQCLGKYISQVQIVELVKALLRLPGLRRAEGSEGRIRYEQTFPANFVVCFEADRAG